MRAAAAPLFVLALGLCAAVVFALPSCRLTAPNGQVTDISRLNGIYTTGTVQAMEDPPGYEYQIAICQDVQEHCYNPNLPDTMVLDSVTQNRPRGSTGAWCKRLGAWNDITIVDWINYDLPQMGVRIVYSDGHPYNHVALNRTTVVDVFCNQDYSDLGHPDVAFDHEDYEAGVYYFKMNSVAGCPIGGGGGLSGGWIFIIVFFCCVAVYLAIGVAYNLIAKKATGVEALPNVAFWKAFFGCVADGVQLVFCCRTPNSYSSMGGGSASAKYSTNASAEPSGYQTGI